MNLKSTNFRVNFILNKEIVDKYNVSGPRYTSYPTVPFWQENPIDVEKWKDSFEINHRNFEDSDISLYIHLPFCESLCTFCGCHKRITKNHSVEEPYINAILAEWKLYKDNLSFIPSIKELHLGGGTPTFFSPTELKRMLLGIFGQESVNPDEVTLSFEAHPNNTTEAHLTTLFDFGFRRLSFGIQDYSPVVQKAINRIQSYEKVKSIHNLAKEIGYSVSHDLVFGLPKQTLEDIINSVNKTIELKPERISLYGYAHVPWMKGNGQRGFDESDIPSGEEKRKLYEVAKQKLESFGYIEVGMDHFALPSDELAIAFQEKTLHRNFMGYTVQNTSKMIGLGASAISDSWFGFAQNEKKVETYMEMVQNGIIPVYRGHFLSDLDLEIRQYILDLMCHFETELKIESPYQSIQEEILSGLEELEKDGILTINGRKITVTTDGIPFVRNCCMVFDQSLKEKQSKQLFSKTI